MKRFATLAALGCLMTTGMASAASAADARLPKRHPATRLLVVDAQPAALPSSCAVEIYPYAPSGCLPGGYLVFDGKAYFAPRTGYRAYRYSDGW